MILAFIRGLGHPMPRTLGRLLTILGGVVGAVILGHIENPCEAARQKDAHVSAVRAVSLELSSDVAGIEGLVGIATSIDMVGSLTMRAYDSLLLPLYRRQSVPSFQEVPGCCTLPASP